METLRYVVLVNGLLAIVSVAFYVLLRRETYFSTNRLVLWLGLVAAFVLPLVELPDWRPQPVRAVMQRTAQVIVPRVLPSLQGLPADVTITFPNKKTYQAFQVPQERSFWSWQIVLVVSYCLVVFILLVRFSLQLMSLKRIISQSVHEAYDGFTLVQNKGVTSPFSFFGWVVLNPDQHTPDELEQILRHERVHVQERHSLDILLAEWLCIIFWFNPAVYLFRYLLHQTLEFRADQVVLSEGIDARAYQYNLLKVSLSTNQSAITNDFSKSQLKSRIAMLNQRESTTTAWLKYATFLLAFLIAAIALARPKRIQIFRTYASQPLAATIATRINSSERPTGLAHPTSMKSTLVRNPALKPVIRPADIAEQRVPADTVRISPSRYMVYQGDYLYWIISPKTTFDDFAVMKQEFAKHNHIMQLNELKYDPLYAYIDRVIITVRRPTGGMNRCDRLNEDGKPITSIGGYIGIGSKVVGSGGGDLLAFKQDFPESLRKTALEEEASTAQFIKEHKLDYLLEEGNKKFKDLGNGSSTYFKEYFKNKSTRASGLLIQPDGSLQVDESLGAIQLFLNNEPVTHQSLEALTVNQLYSVVKKSQYNPARKESFTSALLIYTTEVH